MGKYSEYVTRQLVLGGTNPAPPGPVSPPISDHRERESNIAKMRAVLAGEAIADQARVEQSPLGSRSTGSAYSPGPRLAEECRPTLTQGSPTPNHDVSSRVQLYPHAAERLNARNQAQVSDEARMARMKASPINLITKQ